MPKCKPIEHHILNKTMQIVLHVVFSVVSIAYNRGTFFIFALQKMLRIYELMLFFFVIHTEVNFFRCHALYLDLKQPKRIYLFRRVETDKREHNFTHDN